MVTVAISKGANAFLVAKSRLSGKPKSKILDEYLLVPEYGVFKNDEKR